MAELIPKILFDRVLLTNNNSKSIKVDDPHIQSLKEGIIKGQATDLKMDVQLSAFDVGDSLAQSGWLSLLTELKDYLSYLKVAIAITYDKNTADDFVSRIEKNDISLPYSILTAASKEKAITKENNIIRSVPSGISYGIFNFDSLKRNNEINLLSFLDEKGNYKVPINFSVLGVPKDIKHLQIFVVPFIDVFYHDNQYKNINIMYDNGLYVLKRSLPQPYAYTLKVIEDSKIQNLEIINNLTTTQELTKLELKLPKSNLINKLSLNYEKVLKGEAISELFITKDDKNQQTVFFFVNKKKLITNNSIFADSFKGLKQLPKNISDILQEAAVNIQLIKTELNENDIKISKNNKYLSITNYQASSNTSINNNVIPTLVIPIAPSIVPTTPTQTTPISPQQPAFQQALIGPPNLPTNIVGPIGPISLTNNNTTIAVETSFVFKFIPNVFKDIDLYYFTEFTKDEYNITNTYGLSITLFDPLVDKLREYNKQLTNNLFNLNQYYNLINKPLSSGGFYDLNTNTIKNIESLDRTLESLNYNSNNNFYSIFETINGTRSVTDTKPTIKFARQISQTFVQSFEYINNLFNLQSDTKELGTSIINALSPQLANLESIQFVIDLHKNIIENLSPILNKVKNSESKQAKKNGVNVISEKTTSNKFFVTLDHAFTAKSKTTFYNDFEINNLLLTSFNTPNFSIDNSVNYPRIVTSTYIPSTPYNAEFITLYGRDIAVRSTEQAKNLASTDSAKLLSLFYNDLIKNTISTETLSDFDKSLDDINFDSVSAVLANKNNISTLDIFVDTPEAKEQIQNFSFNSLTRFESNKGLEENNGGSFSKDKSEVITNQLELINKPKILTGIGAKELEQKIDKYKADLAKVKSKFGNSQKYSQTEIDNMAKEERLRLNQIALDKQQLELKSKINQETIKIIDSIDFLIYNLALRNSGIIINESTSVENLLPKFKVQILKSFNQDILTAPVWEDISTTSQNQNIISQQQNTFTMARVIFEPPQNELAKKALVNFEYPNKYFIIESSEDQTNVRVASI